MSHPRDPEWSPEERELLVRLPRERTPRPELADRTVAALRERGWLGSGPAVGPRRARSMVWGLRLAAAVVVFLLGVAAGARWSAAPPGASTAGGPPPENVQRAGTEYVAALVALATLPPSEEASAQGREAALSTLRGAAERVALLPGQSPETARLLLTVRNLGDAGAASGEAPPEGGDGRWF